MFLSDILCGFLGLIVFFQGPTDVEAGRVGIVMCTNGSSHLIKGRTRIQNELAAKHAQQGRIDGFGPAGNICWNLHRPKEKQFQPDSAYSSWTATDLTGYSIMGGGRLAQQLTLDNISKKMTRRTSKMRRHDGKIRC